ncbi:MAG: hypothetical protein Q7K29_05555 [Thermoleophilia bacterium]|nr:hypothetical protein [Thermoleophilia bacterium]
MTPNDCQELIDLDTGDWILIAAVCLAPLPLVAMLLREFGLSFRRGWSQPLPLGLDQEEAPQRSCSA